MAVVMMLRQSRGRLRCISAVLVLAFKAPHVTATSCEDVWDSLFGSRDGETFTCGERIAYLQSPQGGMKTEEEARIEASLESSNCADCWPWERFRASEDGARSSKRGIAIENRLLTAEALAGVSRIVSWGCTWDYYLEGQPDLLTWEASDVDFVPMIWGHGTIPEAQAQGLPPGRRALLGFNEPNFPDQASLMPQDAAAYWPQLEQLAADHGIETIVAPSMNFHPNFHPVDWLYQFFAHCVGCKVDAIGLHVFSCYGAGLLKHLDEYRQFGKPLWVTEIACSDPYTPERLSAEGQMAYMKEAIPLLEADKDVAMYAWFSYFKDQWAHPIVNGDNGDAGIVFPNGTLTPLGLVYDSFEAQENLTYINLTIPVKSNGSNATMDAALDSPSTASTTGPAATVTWTNTGTSSVTSTSSVTRTQSMTSSTMDPSDSGDDGAHEESTSSITTSSTGDTFHLRTTTTATSTVRTAVGTSSTASWTGTSSMSATSSTEEIPEPLENATAGSIASTSSPSTTSATSSTASSGSNSSLGVGLVSTTRFRGSAASSTGMMSTTSEENETESEDGQPCSSALLAWCSSSPSVGFWPNEACSPSLHTALCTGPTEPQASLGGLLDVVELEGWPTPLVLLVMLTVAAATATLTRQIYLQEESRLSRLLAYCLPCFSKTDSQVAPEPLLPLPNRCWTGNSAESLGERTPVLLGSPAVLSKPGTWSEIAVSVDPLTIEVKEAMQKVTSPSVSLEEKQASLAEVGRLLSSNAAALAPEALAWHERQEERLRKASSIAAAVNNLRNGKMEAPDGDRHALLEEAARRASVFAEELSSQRLRLQRRQKKGGMQALGELLEERDFLASLGLEMRELQGAVEADLEAGGRGSEGSALAALQKLQEDVQSALEDTDSMLATAMGESPAKAQLKLISGSSGEDRRAALAEAARRAAIFDEDLQKQRQKLSRRAKGAAAPLELGRMQEEQRVLQELGDERQAALEACRQGLADADDEDVEEWKRLLQVWEGAEADLEQVSKEAEEKAILPEGSVWEAASLHKASRKEGTALERDGNTDHLALLLEATRRAAAFDEELQEQRQRMKKRKKHLQKLSESERQEQEHLLACRNAADASVLKRLAEEQASSAAQCEEALTTGETAWEELQGVWQQLRKDLSKAEKECEAARAGCDSSLAAQILESDKANDAKFGVERCTSHDGEDRREALREAARRVARFEEELSKQRQGMHRRQKRAADAGATSAALAAGHVLLDSSTLQSLALEHSKGREICKDHAKQAQTHQNQEESAAYEDLLQAWDKLQDGLGQAMRDASESVSAAFEEAVGAGGLAQAARRAAAVERAFAQLVAEGSSAENPLSSELRRAKDMLTVQRLLAEQSQGLNESETRLNASAALVEAAGGKDAAPKTAVAGMEAWMELRSLWQDLQKQLLDMQEQLEAKQTAVPASRLSLVRKAMDSSVGDAERRSALAEAVRRASNFDEELERQRQRLSRRKRVAREEPEVSKLLDLGQELELEALVSEHAEAAASCREHMRASQDAAEVDGWRQVLDLYEQLQAPLEEAKEAVKVEPKSEISAHLARLEDALLEIQEELCSDSGPVHELEDALAAGQVSQGDAAAKLKAVRDAACQTDFEEQRTSGGEPDLEQLLAKLEQVSGTATQAKPVEKIEEEVNAVVQRWRLEIQWRKRRWTPEEPSPPLQAPPAPSSQAPFPLASQAPAPSASGSPSPPASQAPSPPTSQAPSPTASRAASPAAPQAPAAPAPVAAAPAPPAPAAAAPPAAALTGVASRVKAPTRQDAIAVRLPPSSEQRARISAAGGSLHEAPAETASKLGRRRRPEATQSDDQVKDSMAEADDFFAPLQRPQTPSPPPAPPALAQDPANLLLDQLEHQTWQQPQAARAIWNSNSGRSLAPAEALPVRPSSAVSRSGAGMNPSHLAPPTDQRAQSRSVSPSSAASSSPGGSINQLQKEGMSKRPASARLDPLTRRGPPLPNAGRLLLTGAHQESPAHDTPGHRSTSPALH